MGDIVHAVTTALAAHIEAEVPDAAAVLAGWPESNVELALPSISITARSPRYTRHNPYKLSIGTVTSNQASVLYCLGHYDINMQIDIWARYPAQRSDIYEALFAALQPVDEKGLQLTLALYHNELCAIDLRGYVLEDSETSASTQIWRLTADIEASCRAVMASDQYIITQEPVLEFELED